MATTMCLGSLQNIAWCSCKLLACMYTSTVDSLNVGHNSGKCLPHQNVLRDVYTSAIYYLVWCAKVCCPFLLLCSKSVMPLDVPAFEAGLDRRPSYQVCSWQQLRTLGDTHLTRLMLLICRGEDNRNCGPRSDPHHHSEGQGLPAS